jgi:hypothetical protein
MDRSARDNASFTRGATRRHRAQELQSPSTDDSRCLGRRGTRPLLRLRATSSSASFSVGLLASSSPSMPGRRRACHFTFLGHEKDTKGFLDR